MWRLEMSYTRNQNSLNQVASLDTFKVEMSSVDQKTEFSEDGLE